MLKGGDKNTMSVVPRWLNVASGPLYRQIIFPMIQCQDDCNRLTGLEGDSNTSIVPHQCYETLQPFEQLP